jgi:ABC-type antimicrobial peptide transport system permease subunit
MGGMMFQNILKLAFRNLSKNRLFSFIGILGLALAIGCFTVAYVFIDMSYNIDSFHENRDVIFYIEILIERSGSTQIWGPTPIPLAPALKQDFPQIQEFVRIRPRQGTFQYGDKIFEEDFLFVDEAFLDMFTFPIIRGNKKALRDKNAVLISDRYAEKYFGSQDPIGKELIVSTGDAYKNAFVVKGIVEKNPKNSSIQFDILLPYAVLVGWENSDLNDWGAWTHTFIQLQNPQDVDILKLRMDKYLQLQNEVNEAWSVSEFLFEPLADIAINSHKVNNDIGRGYPPAAQIGLLIFGVILLLLACFNYINIGIVTATRRLREIGIRKVLGSTKTKLIVQFLGENILICMIAVIVGVLLAKLYFIPWFNNLFQTPLEMDFKSNYRLWLFFGSAFLITGIVTGMYPAFYVSQFKPTHILSRTQKVGGGNKFTRVLLTLQFILTFIMIGSALIFIKNANYQKSIDWGYNQAQIIGLGLDGEKHYTVLRNAVSKNPAISSMSGSGDHIGISSDIDVAEYKGEKYEIRRFLVGHDYLQTMELRLKEGRLFDRNLVTDLDQSIIINEKCVRNMGWDHPIGMHVVIDNSEYSVIGVVEDFYYHPLTDPIEPTLFRLCEEDEFNFLIVKAEPARVIQTAEYLRTTWKVLIPDEPIDLFFQDQVWDWYFRESVSVYKLACFFAFIALVISCMGLFGLISVSIVKRMKEISIRKVFGASGKTIARLLNKDVVIILILSSAVAAPLCFLMMGWYLDYAYEYHTPITVMPFLMATVLILVISILTIFSQVYRASRANPVTMLRME